MINDHQFVLAFHFPPASNTINFFSPASNSVVSYSIDPAGFTNFVDPFSGQRTDLRIGSLTASLNPADQIAIYPIFTLANTADYTGQSLLVYGAGASSPRVGTNTFDSVLRGDLYDGHGTSSPNDDTIGSDNINDTTLFSFDQDQVTGEAFGQGGDSGSPTFVSYNGRLSILGIHSAISTNPNTTYDVFLPAYEGSLTQAGVSFTVVPEPSTAMLLLLAATLIGTRWLGFPRRL